MDTNPEFKISVHQVLRAWWRDGLQHNGLVRTVRRLVAGLWEFLRQSTPEQRRRRYGDVDYDWEHQVDTTSATVGWRDRLLGTFLSPYQPTEPALFREMLEQLAINFSEFTFIDLGSGKGRTLLMASDFPFRCIVGVELVPALHRVAQENIAAYKPESQKCFAVEAACADARLYTFPLQPLVIYLFNPLQRAGLAEVVASLERSLTERPRPVYLLYHNPLLDAVLSASKFLKRIHSTRQYSIYATRFQA